ncbi:MAG TPA: NADH-quinone oxidoreductase subunit C [Candidatus Polarisedimenticolaceae bacterium]|nr:NADH-quinone oxidoreductase subunit C [Candidatus Polarisedimenticolaceae bacterium]
MGVNRVADGQAAVERIKQRFADAVEDSGSYRGQHWVEVAGDRLVEVCEWLRDDPANAYDYLVDVTAVHLPDDPRPMQMVYHLYSHSHDDRLRVKTRADDELVVPTLSDLWQSANWNERETYDMFGIRFDGHPDPRRILMPDDYTDFPLRKEFPLFRG